MSRIKYVLNLVVGIKGDRSAKAPRHTFDELSIVDD